MKGYADKTIEFGKRIVKTDSTSWTLFWRKIYLRSQQICINRKVPAKIGKVALVILPPIRKPVSISHRGRKLVLSEGTVLIRQPAENYRRLVLHSIFLLYKQALLLKIRDEIEKLKTTMLKRPLIQHRSHLSDSMMTFTTSKVCISLY